jgi:hypothetical protein
MKLKTYNGGTMQLEDGKLAAGAHIEMKLRPKEPLIE